MTQTLRLATPADAPGMAAIYAPICRDTAISFELEPPDAAELARRLEGVLVRLPWLVVELDATLAGYAYARPYHERAAYRWSIEVSIYVDAASRGRGVASALYTALLALVQAQGYCVAMAGVTLPNAPSVKLHEAFGFTPIGTYRAVGFKHGAWHDVGYWQRRLQPGLEAPAEPVPLGELAPAAWEAAIATGLARLAARH